MNIVQFYNGSVIQKHYIVHIVSQIYNIVLLDICLSLKWVKGTAAFLLSIGVNTRNYRWVC